MRPELSPPEGYALEAPLEAHPLGATLLLSRGELRCVCKRLSLRGLASEAAHAQLEREADALLALAGRGAPRLLARGTDEAGPFVVMEHLAMPPLGMAAARAGRAPAWMVRATIASFEALARVHDVGFVHGDVSPDNVLVAEDAAEACMVDFGQSRAGGDRGAQPELRGTVVYAAPELARGESVDARADLFALAASLLAAASGALPRGGAGAALLLAAGDRPIGAWAASAAARLPHAVARVLAQCVAFDREARPPNARAVLAVLGSGA